LRKLDVQARLEYARAGVAVLRALQIMGKTMRYHEFGAAIGLIADGEKWEPWHRQQVPEILQLIAATERKAGTISGAPPLEYERIVNEKGKPGGGFPKVSKIVRV
jgi:hypothetical protein